MRTEALQDAARGRRRVRESCARGGAAIWPNLAAVAVCGGVRGCNLAARVGREAWADAPAIIGPRGAWAGGAPGPS